MSFKRILLLCVSLVFFGAPVGIAQGLADGQLAASQEVSPQFDMSAEDNVGESDEQSQSRNDNQTDPVLRKFKAVGDMVLEDREGLKSYVFITREGQKIIIGRPSLFSAEIRRKINKSIEMMAPIRVDGSLRSIQGGGAELDLKSPVSITFDKSIAAASQRESEQEASREQKANVQNNTLKRSEMTQAGLNAFSEKKYDEAIQFFTKSTTQQITRDEKALAHFMLALSYYMINNVDLAKPNFEKAEELDPDDPLYPFQHAVILHEMNEFKRAKDKLNLTLTVNPNYYKALLLRADISINENNFDEARDDIDNYASIKGKDAYYYYYNLLLSYSSNDFEAAKKYFRNLDISILPTKKKAKALYAMHKVFFYDDITLAKDYLEQAVELNPDEGWQRELLRINEMTSF